MLLSVQAFRKTKSKKYLNNSASKNEADDDDSTEIR